MNVVLPFVASILPLFRYLGSPEGDGLRVGLRGGHLDEDAGLLQDLVDGVPLGADDVAVLALLHLHGDLGELALLEGEGEGERRGFG